MYKRERPPASGANLFVSPEELATEFSSPRYGGETDSSGRFQITGRHSLQQFRREPSMSCIGDTQAIVAECRRSKSLKSRRRHERKTLA